MRTQSPYEPDWGTPVVALLLVQICVGYEWLISGLTKAVHGDFTSGLPAQLHEMSKSAPGWYRSFLTNGVIPHSQPFAYAIVAAELVAGMLLLGAAIALLVRGTSLSPRIHRDLRLVTAAAVLVGLVLAVNFELANGGTFGLSLAKDSFDEGVDLDTIMVGLQIALFVFGVKGLVRRERRAPISPSRSSSSPASSSSLLRRDASRPSLGRGSEAR
ncbi:MAG TPA: hypothetical protein VGK68_01750 [Gaiellaceae bacterium]